jgi:hypothetical protein
MSLVPLRARQKDRQKMSGYSPHLLGYLDSVWISTLSGVLYGKFLDIHLIWDIIWNLYV